LTEMHSTIKLSITLFLLYTIDEIKIPEWQEKPLMLKKMEYLRFNVCLNQPCQF
jgi:hypothetical protein